VPGRVFQGYRGEAMQDLGYELPRIPIPRTPVNKGKIQGPRLVDPSPVGHQLYFYARPCSPSNPSILDRNASISALTCYLVPDNNAVYGARSLADFEL
jgi:hypothetical protein